MGSVVGIPILTAILVGIIAVDIKRQRKRQPFCMSYPLRKGVECMNTTVIVAVVAVVVIAVIAVIVKRKKK